MQYIPILIYHGLKHFNDFNGRNPEQPPGMYKTLVNNGITYLHLNWFSRRISERSTEVKVYHQRIPGTYCFNGRLGEQLPLLAVPLAEWLRSATS